MSVNLEREADQDPEELEEELDEYLETEEEDAEESAPVIPASSQDVDEGEEKSEGLVDDAPAQVRIEEPIEEAGIGDDFEPTHPTSAPDTEEADAEVAWSGTVVIDEALEEMEEEDE